MLMQVTTARAHRRVLGLAMVVLLALGASGCTLSESNGTDTVTTGWGIYMNIQEIPTWQLDNGLYVGICHGNISCTATLLAKIEVDGWGATQWHTAITNSGLLNELNGQLYGLAVLGSHSDPYGTEAAKCLVLHADPFNNIEWESAGYNLNNGCGDGSPLTS